MGKFMLLNKEPPIAYNAPYPVFTRLTLETSSNCNRRCSFCPVATGRRNFPAKQMASKLYQSICGQLAELSWSGVIELFLLNEPLLDPQLLDKASKLREACPRSTIYVSTNGDFLRQSKAPVLATCQLFDSGVNSLNLNVYSKGKPGRSRKQFYDRLVRSLVSKKVCEVTTNKYTKKPFTKNFIHISDMRLDRDRSEFYDVIFDKTSESQKTLAPISYCARPHRHLPIMWDGSVPLCCGMDPTDPNGTYIGNASEQSLLALWNCKAFAKHRYFLQQKNRQALRQCRYCHHQMAYPHAVRQIKARPKQVTRWLWEER